MMARLVLVDGHLVGDVELGRGDARLVRVRVKMGVRVRVRGRGRVKGGVRVKSRVG